SPLQTLLEQFDNSRDFQDSTPGSLNTALDVECFRYLTIASLKGSINKEMIQRFYDFGYFQPDKIIECYISLARSEQEIKQRNSLISELKSLDGMKREFQLSPQKIESILDETYFAKALELLEDSWKALEKKISSLQEEVHDLLDVSSKVSSFERS